MFKLPNHRQMPRRSGSPLIHTPAKRGSVEQTTPALSLRASISGARSARLEEREPPSPAPRGLREALGPAGGLRSSTVSAAERTELQNAVGPIHDVQLHDDEAAGRLARSADALAFAVPGHVFLAREAGALKGPRRHALLSHEYAHATSRTDPAWGQPDLSHIRRLRKDDVLARSDGRPVNIATSGGIWYSIEYPGGTTSHYVPQTNTSQESVLWAPPPYPVLVDLRLRAHFQRLDFGVGMREMVARWYQDIHVRFALDFRHDSGVLGWPSSAEILMTDVGSIVGESNVLMATPSAGDMSVQVADIQTSTGRRFGTVRVTFIDTASRGLETDVGMSIERGAFGIGGGSTTTTAAGGSRVTSSFVLQWVQDSDPNPEP